MNLISVYETLIFRCGIRIPLIHSGKQRQDNPVPVFLGCILLVSLLNYNIYIVFRCLTNSSIQRSQYN